MRIAVPVKVPRGIDERIHRVTLTPGRAAALGAGHVHKRSDRFQRRLTLPGYFHVLRETHRQVAFGHGNDAAVRAVNDGDRRAPVPLPGNAPILNAEGDRLLAEPVL